MKSFEAAFYKQKNSSTIETCGSHVFLADWFSPSGCLFLAIGVTFSPPLLIDFCHVHKVFLNSHWLWSSQVSVPRGLITVKTVIFKNINFFYKAEAISDTISVWFVNNNYRLVISLFSEYLPILTSKNNFTWTPLQSFFFAEIKGVLQEVWKDNSIQRNNLSSLAELPNFPDNPSLNRTRKSFETGWLNLDGRYGQRLRAYFAVPESGLYKFNVSCNSACALLIETEHYSTFVRCRNA